MKAVRLLPTGLPDDGTHDVPKHLADLLTSNVYIISVHVKLGVLVILVVLYGCETWSLTLREERRLRVF